MNSVTLNAVLHVSQMSEPYIPCTKLDESEYHEWQIPLNFLFYYLIFYSLGIALEVNVH